MADVDTKTVGKAFKVEVNGQFLPIKSYSGGDLTAEKAEASSGASQQNQSTMGHQPITDEALGAKVVAFGTTTAVSVYALGRVVDHINNSYKFAKKFMKMPIPKLVKNLDHLTGPKPVWPETLMVGNFGVASGVAGTVLMISAAIVKSIADSPTGQGPLPPEIAITTVNLLTYLGLGTGVLAIGLASYFLTRHVSKMGFIGLLFGGLAVLIFAAPFFIQF